MKERELNNRLIMHENGRTTKEKRHFFEPLSISKLVLPIFNEEKRYRIQVENDGQELRADLFEIDQEEDELKPLKQVENLIEEVKAGNLKNVKEILRKNKSLVHGKNALGFTALFYAAREGHKEIAKFLLQEIGVEPNVDDLVVAARAGNTEIVELFLSKNNLDINGLDSSRNTALMEASSNGFEKIVRLLLAQDEIKVNITNYFMKTALMMAEKPEVVELLLQNPKIDVTVKDFEGYTAQKRAEKVKNQALVELFKKHQNKTPVSS